MSSPHIVPHRYIIKGILHVVSHLYHIRVIYSLTNGSETTALKIIIVKKLQLNHNYLDPEKARVRYFLVFVSFVTFNRSFELSVHCSPMYQDKNRTLHQAMKT